MIPGLLDRLDARFVFVVGKGGVGKSTTAAAVALAMADAGSSTHLISTDPAHSAADVLDLPPSGPAIRPAPCTDLLTVEELDAHEHARRWTERAGPSLAELVEHGTYLDAEDTGRFLELSLPGIDEIMAALRLVELSRGDAGRIVVDTAPTGHTLRLLDSGRIIAGWIATFRAMGRKASAVASALMRADVRLSAEAMLDELEARVAEFESAVLAHAAFVVVTRTGAVVQAETDRLLRELAQRRLRVAAVIRIGAVSDARVELRSTPPAARDERERMMLEVPLGDRPRGCEGLRRWGVAGGVSPGAQARGAPPIQDSAVSRGDAIARRDGARRVLADPATLLFFTGKGGVGKSTCAAAVALAIARTRPVSLFGIDPAGSIGDVLGIEIPADGATIGERLRVRELDAESEFDRLRQEYREEVDALFARFGLRGGPALDRAVLESLWDSAPPGIDELFALVEILDQAEAGGVLVVDTAPTGHFLRLLELPELALEWTHAILRLFLKYHIALDLDDGARSVLRFAKRLKDFRQQLTDPGRTSVYVVTLDEPVVRAETDRLLEALARAGLHATARIVNRSDAGTSAAGRGRGDAPDEIHAPGLATPPVGADALELFFAEWQLA